MKILLINDYFTPRGGAELQALVLRKALRERGHDARIFASRAEGIPGSDLVDYSCFGTISPFRTLVQTANPLAFVSLRRTLTEFQPDVVHVMIFLTQLSPLILPLLRNIPSLYHVHWYRPVCPIGTKMLPDRRKCTVKAGAVCYSNGCLPIRDWIPLMLQLKLWHRWQGVFNAIVATSEAAKQILVAEGIQPVQVIHNGIPTADLRPPLSSPPTVTFAGRLVREKGVDILIESFRRIVELIWDARLLIAGDGPERLRLERMTQELGISSKVVFLGHISRDAVEHQFSTGWVQAVPSLWEEPFGLTAAEAMMRGTAVVASRSGGLQEIIRDSQSGFLVPPGDPEALSAALLNLLQDRELAEELGRGGREIAMTNFSEATFTDRMIRLYSSLIK